MAQAFRSLTKPIVNLNGTVMSLVITAINSRVIDRLADIRDNTAKAGIMIRCLIPRILSVWKIVSLR